MQEVTVYGLGIGPGDPELLTVKAVNLMKHADVVIVPQSDVTGKSVAKDIVKHYIPEEKMLLYLFPMTNDQEDLDTRYTDVAAKIADLTAEGKTVCYVTIGDASIFSTFNYLATKLKERNIRLEMVPGIPSFTAGANLLGTSIVEKGEKFCVVEMPSTEAELAGYTEQFDTVIVMKVHKRLGILKQFVSNHPHAQAHLVQRAYLDGQRILDLNTDDADAQAGYLSIAILKRG